MSTEGLHGALCADKEFGRSPGMLIHGIQIDQVQRMIALLRTPCFGGRQLAPVQGCQGCQG